MTHQTPVVHFAVCLLLASTGCPADNPGTGNNNTNQNTNGNQQAVCGNEVLEIGEQCDDGAANSDTAVDACRTDCRDAWCGDEVVDTGEACDDSNLDGQSCTTISGGFTGGDLGCTTTCTHDTDACSTCGNNIIEGAEKCDGANLGSGTCASEFGMQHGVVSCDASCLYVGTACHVCGNGTLEGPETCDDGNLVASDGCGVDCRAEQGWNCSGTPSVCVQVDTCNQGTECLSNHCVDGYCCDTACASICGSCGLAGLAGTCSPIPQGTDPATECSLCESCNGNFNCDPQAAGTDLKNECTADAADTCGQDGSCDGSGSCDFWGTTTICAPQSCTGQIFSPEALCNGTGSCNSSFELCEDFYVCDGAGWACLSVCTTDNDCVANYWCDGGACRAELPDGDGCTGGNQCESGICVDGVCCDAACTGLCQSCNAGAPNSGTCTFYQPDTDPEDDCGACTVCGGSGSCVNVTINQDPVNDCLVQSMSSCGTTGVCNGLGQCSHWPGTTLCEDYECFDHRTQTNRRFCDGAGTCEAPTYLDCGLPNSCDPIMGECSP